MKEYIVDSCIFTGFLASEDSAEKFADILDQAFEGKAQLIATTVNLGEVYFSACRYVKAETVKQFLNDLRQKYSLKIVTPNYEDCLEAARIKTQGGVSYFDCFNLVLAKKLPKAEVLTLDKEYQKFANDYQLRFL